MIYQILFFSLVGIMLDIHFISMEYKGKMLVATILKGLASLVFVIMGIYLYSLSPSKIGGMIVAGLVLGMVGDIFLNMRNLFEGATSNKVFAVGILAFLLGHFMYIAALYMTDSNSILIALIMTIIIAVAAIPPLMKVITAPSKGLKIFGYVYLTIVIAMFSSATALLIKSGVKSFSLVFTIGALLFMVSDFIMIYYSFGKKIKPLRAINLITYYIGQLLIAACIIL